MFDGAGASAASWRRWRWSSPPRRATGAPTMLCSGPQSYPSGSSRGPPAPAGVRSAPGSGVSSVPGPSSG